MKYRVKLKTTVTAWVEGEIDDNYRTDETEHEMLEWAADDVTRDGHESDQFRDRLAAAGFEHGPIELADEDLAASVQIEETR